MSQLKARCIDQVLTFENTPVITSGDVNYDSIMFDFCSRWDGFTKTAIFYRSEDEVYYQLLDEANTCLIPNEVLTDKGDIFIGVFGVSGDTTLTSQVLKYKITRGAITENLKPADPTPDIYAQLISRYNHYDERLAYFEERFNGSVGDAEKFGGQLPDYYATAESVTNVVNGTTKVKKASEADKATNATNADDAKTLDGHGAEDFVPKSGGEVKGDLLVSNPSCTTRKIKQSGYGGNAYFINQGDIIIRQLDIVNPEIDGDNINSIRYEFSTDGGATWNTFNLLHTGNMGNLPGPVGLRERMTINADSSNEWKTSVIQYNNMAYFRNGIDDNNYYDISIGIDGGYYCNGSKNGNYFSHLIHHDGNSAKVHIGTSAPSDTSGNVLFINTSK